MTDHHDMTSATLKKHRNGVSPASAIIPALPKQHRIQWADSSICVMSPAKINLNLHVSALQDDGYHPIDSVMLAVSLCDRVCLSTLPDNQPLSCTCDNADLPTDRTNLAVRAAEAMAEHAQRTPAVKMHIIKRIPVGAGLAGGSSNAATVLIALNHLWNLNWPTCRLDDIAATIGSDVSFFLHTPLARCTGRGEHVQPLSMTGDGTDDTIGNGPTITGRTSSYPPIVLILPGVSVSTAQVYQQFDRMRQERTDDNDTSVAMSTLHSDIVNYLSVPPRHVHHITPEALDARLINDLTAPALAVSHELNTVWQSLVDALGARLHLTGSGSGMFVLCRDTSDAHAVRRLVWQNAPETPAYIVYPNPW